MNEVMVWKPFGLTLTYERFDELLAWYIDKYYSERLNTMEVINNAVELHS